MDNCANIPLGTPREGSWEQGWLTKLEGKEAWAGMEKILASCQCNHYNDQAWETISSRSQSTYYQEAHQCMDSENKAWKTHVPPHSNFPPPFGSSLLFFQDEMGSGGSSPTQGWSHSEVWPSNSSMTCLKLQQLMEHGEYKSNWREINLTSKALLFTEHLHLKSSRWAL